MKETFVDNPIFTVAELARIAGLARGTADQWVHRGIIKPARVEQLSSRRRVMFSIRSIVTAKLVRLMLEHVATGPSDSAAAAEIAELFEGQDWMIAMEGSTERGAPYDIYVAFSRINGCWKWELNVGGAFTPKFAEMHPYIMCALKPVFASVYDECHQTYKAGRGTSS